MTHNEYPTRLDICDGKYTLIIDTDTGRAECLRYGEKWRDLVGDKMVLALFDELVEARARAEAAKAEAEALRAKVEQMERQKPAAWAATDETKTVVEALGMNQSRRFDSPLFLAAGAQPAPNAVAYLDLGVGGYVDIGTDLTDEELDAIPKGRHILGIVGTYGVDGYSPAQPAPSAPGFWQPIETAPRNQAFLAVLNCAGEQTICTMRWPVAEAKNSRPEVWGRHVERVTHWMPLPDLPGAKGE